MPVEKQRVLDRFNAKFGTVSMPKMKSDAMSAEFANLISDDATDEVIDSFLETMNKAHSFKDIAADEHRKANPPKPTPKPEPAPADQPNPSPAPADDTPAWVTTLMENQKTLAEKLQALEGEKTQNAIVSKAKELLGSDVPEAFYKKRQMPATLEEAEAWAAEVKQDFTEVQQTISNNSIGSGRPPFGDTKGGKKEASKEEISAIMANM